MKPVLGYAEMRPNNFNTDFMSIVDVPSRTYNPTEKEMLYTYLTDISHVKYASASFGCANAFTGGKLAAAGDYSEDGEYYWYDTLPQYLLLYDVALPEEFIQHVYDCQ